MRISDWSSDVCSSDLHLLKRQKRGLPTFSEWSSNNMDRETGPSLSNMPGMRISHCLKSRTPIAALMDKRGGGSSISSVVLVSSLRKSQIGRASCREGVSVRVDLGGRRIIKKKTSHNEHRT